MYLNQGMYALKTAGLTAQFCKSAHSEGRERKITDERGLVALEDPSSKSVGSPRGDSPEIASCVSCLAASGTVH